MRTFHSRSICVVVGLSVLAGGCDLEGLLDDKSGNDSSDTGTTGDDDDDDDDDDNPGDDDDDNPGDDDDDDDAPSEGWTVIPLIDDGDIWHSGNDLVTGIHFRDLDDGIVVTTGDNQTFSDGGAVFGATRSQVTDIRFGSVEPLCLLGTIDFTGIVPTGDGYVAMAHACDLISSQDGGATFGIQLAAVGDPFGIEDVLAFRSSGGRTVMVRDSGVVSVTTDPPGPGAIWDDIWAPRAVPPIPNPVPAEQCQGSPDSNNVPSVSQAVYVSEDTQFIAYTSSPDYDPQICISRDGGHSFFPSLLQGVPDDVLYQAPIGVLFNTPDTGITWMANYIYPDSTYIYYTEDGGESWSSAQLPADLAGVSMELRQAFFAPGSQTGFIVGYDYDHSLPLLLKTTDNGKTFTNARGDLAQKALAAGGGKLWTGFALDEDHIWVGGEYGLLMSHSNGGE